MPHIQHWRLTCHGLVAGENCSFGVAMAGDATVPPGNFGNFADLTAVVQAARTPFSTMLTAQANMWSTSTTWKTLRIQERNDQGEVSGTAESDFSSPILGTATQALPSFCSMVVTLLTDRPGRKFRGRIYLPAISSTAVAAGKYSSTAVSNIADAVNTMLGSLNTLAAIDAKWPGLSCIVASAGTITGHDAEGRPITGPGVNTKITRVRANELVDTQRRRQNETIPLVVNTYSVTP